MNLPDCDYRKMYDVGRSGLFIYICTKGAVCHRCPKTLRDEDCPEGWR